MLFLHQWSGTWFLRNQDWFTGVYHDVSFILPAEKNATELVEELLTMTEKARRMEELLEQMERERSDNTIHRLPKFQPMCPQLIDFG